MNWWQNLLVATVSGLFGGGLLYLAARSKTKGEVKVALAKVGADHETAVRSVAIEELEASLLRLVEENKELKAEARKHDERIAVLEAEYASLRESERKCQTDLAFLRGKIAVLESAAPSVTVTTANNAAPAAQPTEE